jgi:formimidoylglutamate deiminase
MTSWLPDFVLQGGYFEAGTSLSIDRSGSIIDITKSSQMEGNDRTQPIRLSHRALLPGLVNAHSHAFQRVIRGRTEHRTQNRKESFWTWREMMYSAATRLTPDDVYDASRMAFLEMALGGITAVGEFHYLHHPPEGGEYADPNLLAKEVVRAASDVGLRIILLRVAYARSGYEKDPDPQQSRFIETDPQLYLKDLEQLRSDFAGRAGFVGLGVAPHSVRAVPLDYLREVIRYGDEEGLPIHMHVAEQPAEVSACIQEHGRSPVALLATEGLLSEHFTAVHAIHVTPKAVQALAEADAMVCACPTTERNLGDGVVPADLFFAKGVRISFGSDSNVQIDLLEDARELEYHLRLQKMERALLAPAGDDSRSSLARRLFDGATINGASSIGTPGGTLESGRPADFFTVDLDDPSIAGAGVDDLLAGIVFGISRTAVRDVVVGGRVIVSEGRHKDQDEIISKFTRLQRKLWS